MTVPIDRCPKCGAPISPDDVVCPVCGAKLKSDFLERLLPILRPPKKEEIRPLNFLERIYYLLLNPSLIFQDYALSLSAKIPMFYLLLNILLDVLIFDMFYLHLPTAFTYYGLIGLFIASVTVFFAHFVLFVIFVAVISLMPFLLSKIYSGKSNYQRVFMISLISLAPLIFYKLLVIGVVAVYNLPTGVNNPLDIIHLIDQFYASSTFTFLTYIEAGFYIWIALLLAVGLRELSEIPINNALLISAATTGLILAVRFVILA